MMNDLLQAQLQDVFAEGNAMTSYRRNGLREATMRIHLLLCCFCVLTGGCAHVLANGNIFP